MTVLRTGNPVLDIFVRLLLLRRLWFRFVPALGAWRASRLIGSFTAGMRLRQLLTVGSAGFDIRRSAHYRDIRLRLQSSCGERRGRKRNLLTVQTGQAIKEYGVGRTRQQIRLRRKKY